MNEHIREDLTNARRKLKNVRIDNRLLSVRMMVVNHKSITGTVKDMAREIRGVTGRVG